MPQPWKKRTGSYFVISRTQCLFSLSLVLNGHFSNQILCFTLMFGQWCTVVVDKSEVQIVILDAGPSDTCAVTKDVTSQKADRVITRNFQILASSRNWYSWIQSCSCKYKNTLYITGKTYELPVLYREPKRTLKCYENYDIRLLICKASIVAKWCTNIAVELYMRFASSFVVIFLKRVNELDLLNLYIMSSLRFQLIHDIFIYYKESKRFLGEEWMLSLVYL
jgi:hypothetical protein